MIVQLPRAAGLIEESLQLRWERKMPPEWSHASHEQDASRPDLSQLPEQFPKLLQQSIGQSRYEKWFENRTTVSVNGDVLIVGVASPFLTQWMQREFHQVVLKVARSFLGPGAQITFEVDQSAAEQLAILQSQTQSTVPGTAETPLDTMSGVREDRHRRHSTSAVNQSDKPSTQSRPSLSPRRRRFASLNQFISGQGNRVAHEMARLIAEQPGEKYNPYYLYGGVGIGKTHLLEGIHRRIREVFPEWQVMSLTAEAFGNYYTRALQTKSLPAFRKRFRSVDVLIVDDIDFLDAKKGFQEEFCHTIQELISYGRQVVLAADRHPRMLTQIRPELGSRLMSGLVTRLEAPDQQTRSTIVRQRAESAKLPVTDDAIELIARKFSRNVRELIGAINCLQTYHMLQKRKIGITAAREVLQELERDCLRIVKTSDIQQAVCCLFGLDLQELISSRKSRHLTQPRQLAMYLVRQWTQSAYQEIGKEFGGRNHSTVMSAEKKIKQMLERDDRMTISTRDWSVREIVSTLKHQLQVG